MKKIEAVIRKEQFNKVKESLRQNGVDFFTFHEVYGVGNQPSKFESYRGTSYEVDAYKRIHLTIVVGREKLDTIVNLLLNEARTGEIGDGKILISDIEKIIRIRDGQLNEHSLDQALV